MGFNWAFKGLKPIILDDRCLNVFQPQPVPYIERIMNYEEKLWRGSRNVYA